MKSSSSEAELAQAQWAQMRANLKAYLKGLGKNQIIQVVFEQLDLYLVERDKVKQLEAKLSVIEGTQSEAKN